MGYLAYKKGETIKCRSFQEMKKVHDDLVALGIKSDFLYEKNGVEGMWVIIEPTYKGGINNGNSCTNQG